MANEQRFSGKAEVYETYRPSYPQELIDYLSSYLSHQGKSLNSCTIADIGAGTGKFTRLLLERGFQVIAVEPNLDMASKLQKLVYEFPNQLTIQLASAEQTGLNENSIDMIVCAQAFHWINEAEARVEWKKILKRDGSAALIWNQRDTQATSFMQAYEQFFLSYDSTADVTKSYRSVGHKSINEKKLLDFFGQEPQCYSIPSQQLLTEQGLIGRVTSSSYAVKEEDFRYNDYIEEIKHMYSTHQKDGIVAMQYVTTCYLGTFV